MSYKLSCIFKRETDSALLIYDFASDEDLWIPLSQIDSIHGRQSDGTGEGTLVVSDWIAKKKGLIV